MNITPTTITAYTLTLTEPELKAIIADLPAQSRFVGTLKAAINGAFDEEAGPGKTDNRGLPIKTHLRRYQRRPKEANPSTSGTLSCSVCGKTFKHPKRLANHMAEKHSGGQTES